MRARLLGALLGLGALGSAGCAGVGEVPGVRPVKYLVAGADQDLRANLVRAQTRLRAREYEAAVRSLRRALWDVEQIDQLWLRLEELAEVHRALGEAYSGLGKSQWSEEEHALAQAVARYAPRDQAAGPPDAGLARAKAAYRAARFREAVDGFWQALVELEGLEPTPARLRALGETRCHLVLAYFALDLGERAAEEARRLAARPEASAACRRQAPPPVRTLLRDAETSEARVGARSAD